MTHNDDGLRRAAQDRADEHGRARVRIATQRLHVGQDFGVGQALGVGEESAQLLRLLHTLEVERRVEEERVVLERHRRLAQERLHQTERELDRVEAAVEHLIPERLAVTDENEALLRPTLLDLRRDAVRVRRYLLVFVVVLFVLAEHHARDPKQHELALAQGLVNRLCVHENHVHEGY